MRLLKISLIAVGLLVILKVAEVLLNKFSPLTILFHQNLLRSLQLLVLAWLFISLLIALIFRRRPARALKIATLSILFLSLLFEILFGYWLQHPAIIPSFLLPSFRQYYIINYRKVIQVESSCAEFDPEFFYRLRRNVQCNFSNIEFSSLIETNSAGLRDDETSLISPDVICLGDSYTMGWGVQQQQTFSQQLEQMSGLKVLNAGMSSFGTVRELRKFRTLDTTNCKWIVLQYYDNDVEETKPFIENRYTLKISPKPNYDTLVKQYQWNRVYYPGKTFLSVKNYVLKDVVKRIQSKDTLVPVGNIKVSMDETVRLFAETLAYFDIADSTNRLIVLYANERRDKDNRFTDRLQQLLQTAPYAEKFRNNVFLLNTSQLLDESDRYVLDDHYNNAGHKKIATAIKGIIDKNTLPEE